MVLALAEQEEVLALAEQQEDDLECQFLLHVLLKIVMGMVQMIKLPVLPLHRMEVSEMQIIDP